MPQLNNSFINEIRRALNTNRFSAEDFDISFPDMGKTLAQITFNHSKEYKLSLTQETYTDHRDMEDRMVIFAVMSPGAHKVTEQNEISSLGRFTEYIPKWCEYIYKDLIELNVWPDPLEEMRRHFSEQVSKNFENPELPFTTEELISIRLKIDNLYLQVEEFKDQLKLNKEQLNQVKSELEGYKTTAENLPKGMWAKVTSNKLIRFFGHMLNTPEGQQFLFKTIPKSLGMKIDA